MEIEAKFIIPTHATYRRLLAAESLAGYLLSPAELRQIQDSYLDTADRAIEKAGSVCRKRVLGTKIVITLKEVRAAADALHRREELEVALNRNLPPSRWPAGPVRDRVLQWIGSRPLRKRFGLSQLRQVRLMHSPQASSVAELSVDEVRLGSRRGKLLQRVCEVELLQTEAELDLEALQRCLAQDWKLLPEPCSKYERALAYLKNQAARKARARIAVQKKRPPAPKPSSRPGVSVSDTAAESVRKTLLLHFKRMVRHERGTRLGEDIEELHDMRVATRRMRAALRIFTDHIDTRAFKPFAKDLRKLGRTLGAVRDLDVFKLKAGQYLATLPPERSSELDPLLGIMEAEQRHAREKMLLLLNSERHKQFKKKFAAFLKQPGAAALPERDKRGTPRPRQIRLLLPVALYQHLANVLTYDALIRDPEVSPEPLHRLRIALKGLRYTLEFFRDVLHPDALTAIEAIKKLQDHLGNIQDAVVTCFIVRHFLTWGTWGHGRANKKIAGLTSVIAPGVAAYLLFRQTELKSLVDTFPAAWGSLQRNSLAAHIARIVQAL